MKENEKNCSDDMKTMTDTEFQKMHDALKEVFNDAVSDYHNLKKFSDYSNDTYKELRQARISIATAAQTLLETEHEARGRIEARRDLRKKVLAHS